MNAVSFHTKGFHSYNVQFSPFLAHRLSCVAGQNFGIAGGGALFILDNTFDCINCYRIFYWPNDGLYDLCWSEVIDNIVWSCSGDGHIQVWDVNSPIEEPIKVIKGHEREIYSCEWSQFRGDPPSVITCSWDHSIKLWDAITADLIGQFIGHDNIVYCGRWSPHLSGTFASTSADSSLKIWSVRDPKPSLMINASNGEVLTCDWCKYNENIIVTGSTDGAIHGWDLRSPVCPLFTLLGHTKTVKAVKFSPFKESVIGSVSYDFTTRVWDSQLMAMGSAPLLMTLQHHREFVYGLDFNLHIPNQIVDCGWDQMIHVFDVNI